MYSRFAEVMLGAVFCVSGVLKAADRNWPAAAAAFGGPAWLARPLPWAEMALGGCLVAGLARPLPSVTAAALLVAFTGAIALRLRWPEPPPCACFGGWSTGPAGPADLVRNALLILVAVVAVLAR